MDSWSQQQPLRRFEAKKNFIESSAAYSLVIYFLQAPSWVSSILFCKLICDFKSVELFQLRSFRLYPKYTNTCSRWSVDATRVVMMLGKQRCLHFGGLLHMPTKWATCQRQLYARLWPTQDMQTIQQHAALQHLTEVSRYPSPGTQTAQNGLIRDIL